MATVESDKAFSPPLPLLASKKCLLDAKWKPFFASAGSANHLAAGFVCTGRHLPLRSRTWFAIQRHSAPSFNLRERRSTPHGRRRSERSSSTQRKPRG